VVDQDRGMDPSNDQVRPAYRTPAAMDKARAEVATGVALVTLLMLGVAFLSGLSVLDGYEFANKFENGEWPPGTDVHALQLAARVSIGAAMAGVISMASAAAIRASTGVKVIGAVAAVVGLLYVPLGLLIAGIAF